MSKHLRKFRDFPVTNIAKFLNVNKAFPDRWFVFFCRVPTKYSENLHILRTRSSRAVFFEPSRPIALVWKAQLRALWIISGVIWNYFTRCDEFRNIAWNYLRARANCWNRSWNWKVHARSTNIAREVELSVWKFKHRAWSFLYSARE